MTRGSVPFLGYETVRPGGFKKEEYSPMKGLAERWLRKRKVLGEFLSSVNI